MTTESWNLIFIIIIAILGAIDIFGMVLALRMYRENCWARKKIHKLITGDNIEMSLETLSLYYHISEERIDQLLTMERDYERDNNKM